MIQLTIFLKVGDSAIASSQDVRFFDTPNQGAPQTAACERFAGSET